MISDKQIASVCQKSEVGKGSSGKSVDRCQRICAAGVPTAQGQIDIKSSLQQYLLQDEVDALLSDAIIPPPPPKNLAPLRHPVIPDQRHRHFNSDHSNIVNPPMQSNFQSLANDLRSTAYKSYWKKRLGEGPDPTPMFPKGYDIKNTRYGKKSPSEGSLYELIMPRIPLPNLTHKSKEPGFQTERNYCKPAFNPDMIFGSRSNIVKEGKYVRCTMSDPKVVDGTSHFNAISSIQADRQELYKPSIESVLAPNKNIHCVPEGYSFGIVTETEPGSLPECLSMCTINPELHFLRDCFAYLNTLRRIISTRCLPSFFHKLNLILKREDKENSGWIPKDIVYTHCTAHRIRFDPSQIEPLLYIWGAFDGSKIYYETFCRILNFKTHIPQLPKVPDMHPDCLDYRTTYQEMVKPGKPREESPVAGVPSDRYFDLGYSMTPDGTLADKYCLPDELDVKSCLYPSIFTMFHVNHRDMYVKREPEVVRRVFEAAGEEFTDEKFNKVWEEAKKHHSQGWVCYETFRRALNQLYPCCI